MTILRGILGAMFVLVIGYTLMAITKDGVDFLTPFFTNLLTPGWTGQFNLDFMCYLILSALWIAWRHGFSAGGLVIAALAGVFGIMVFAPYVLVMIVRAEGSFTQLLLGRNAE